jgi:hypothetical protein
MRSLSPGLITRMAILATVSAIVAGPTHAGTTPGDDAALAITQAVYAPHSRITAAISPASPAQSKPLRIPGVAQTSVDHRFSSEGLTGSAGFLCGMQPGAARTGPASAAGYDPMGRFLGAKLSLAFK